MPFLNFVEVGAFPHLYKVNGAPCNSHVCIDNSCCYRPHEILVAAI